jgi:hypothetical protein
MRPLFQNYACRRCRTLVVPPTGSVHIYIPLPRQHARSYRTKLRYRGNRHCHPHVVEDNSTRIRAKDGCRNFRYHTALHCSSHMFERNVLLPFSKPGCLKLQPRGCSYCQPHATEKNSSQPCSKLECKELRCQGSIFCRRHAIDKNQHRKCSSEGVRISHMTEASSATHIVPRRIRVYLASCSAVGRSEPELIRFAASTLPRRT